MSAFTHSKKSRYLFVAIPLLWLLATSMPEVLRDRIYPFDSALIAANGGLFERLFAEFGAFLEAPSDWMWAYYDQYPAMSVRRHPPLFGFVSGIVYTATGVSASAAKFTVMLFACVFAVGCYAVSRRMLSEPLFACLATLLIIATPEVAMHFHTVWLDVPALAFAIWVIYFYVARLDGDTSLRNALLLAGFAVLALYTYQPVIVLLAGVFLHLLAREHRMIFRDRSVLIAAAGMIVAMLPLVVFTLYFARDNLLATTGEIPTQWKEFDSDTYAGWMNRNKLSLAYWTEYARYLLQCAPLQIAGMFLWSVLRLWRRPKSAEVMLLICFLVTYIGFSWLPVKGHRYVLYMVLPASILSVMAVRDLATLVLADGRSATAAAAAALLACTVLQFGLVPPYAPYLYMSGFDKPITRILEGKPDANILYSGRNDAAFVFFTRANDEAGLVTVHRASVQLTNPRDLAAYIEKNDIHYVVIEIDNPGFDSLEIIEEFRVAIIDYVSADAGFAAAGAYRLPLGVSEVVHYVSVEVYERSPAGEQ